MKKAFKIISAVVGLLVLLIGLWVVNNFVYPFQSVHPNYSDVEAAFAKLQFPSDWREISSSENRGLHGRGCDFLNNAGCFHKGKTFSVPERVTKDNLKQLLIDSGCLGTVESEFTYDGDAKPSFNLECGLSGGVRLGATIRGPESKVSVTVRTY